MSFRGFCGEKNLTTDNIFFKNIANFIKKTT